MIHYHRARVVGSGPLPVDMLRYDRCYPESAEDCLTMAVSMGVVRSDRPGHHSVTVVQPSASKQANWTPERWRSFGWTLGEIG